MSVKQSIAKLVKLDGAEDAVGKDAIAELLALQESGNAEMETVKKELKEEKAKAARILNEKKSTQAKLDELTAEVEEMKSSGLSDSEKLQQQMEKLQKAREKAEAEKTTLAEQLVGTKRAHALGRIGSKIRFMDNVPDYMKEAAIDRAFKDVKDLDDDDTVKAVLDSFQEEHKGLIASDSHASGTGGAGGGGADGTGGGTTTDPSKMSIQERAKQLTGHN